MYHSDRPRPERDTFNEGSVEPRDQAPLDRLQQGLSAGHRDAVVALFRYFEELVGPRTAATDRRIVGYLLRLVEEELGRPLTFERSPTLSNRYVSAQVESASGEQWNVSTCLFKSYVLRTVFAHGESKRPTELVATLCTGPRVERPALRQIDFRFTNPDAVTGGAVQSILERTVIEARRLTASDR